MNMKIILKKQLLWANFTFSDSFDGNPILKDDFLSYNSYQDVWPNFPAAAKPLQLCPNLCDPIEGSPPGSPVPGILQARTLEWVAISFSNAWNWKVKVKSLSRVQLFAIPWTAAYQAPLSMGFSRQECHHLLQNFPKLA